jgi:hypothetical protein
VELLEGVLQSLIDGGWRRAGRRVRVLFRLLCKIMRGSSASRGLTLMSTVLQDSWTKAGDSRFAADLALDARRYACSSSFLARRLSRALTLT